MTTCASDQRDFTQTDPLPYGPGSTFESAYAYAGNNPVVYTDPSGLRKKSSYQSGLDFIGSEMPSNSMWAQKYGIDGCRGWIVGFTCYKEQLVAKGPTFASKVGNGKPMDYKSNKGFLNSINHESFTVTVQVPPGWVMRVLVGVGSRVRW